MTYGLAQQDGPAGVALKSGLVQMASCEHTLGGALHKLQVGLKRVHPALRRDDIMICADVPDFVLDEDANAYIAFL